MSMLNTLKYMNSPNVAKLIDDEDLDKLGKKVCEDYKEDHDTMAKWREGVEQGRKTAAIESEPKSFPWEKASNYKDPLITESIIQFGDRASSEILTAKNLVKASVENDQPEVAQRKTRLAKFMNWQFNYEMREWRDQQEHLLYELAGVGVVFKKVFFNPADGRNESSVIHYPNFAVNNDDFNAAENRFSLTKNYSDNDVDANVRAGIWLEFEIEDKDEDERNKDDDEEGDDKDTLLEDDYIEQWTSYDLDDDGYAEPYIVTVHRESSKVVRIVPRYDEDCIYVKSGEGMTAPLNRVAQQRQQEVAQQVAMERQAELQEEMQSAMNGGAELDEIDPQAILSEIQEEIKERVYSDIEIIKIKPLHNIVKYGFIPDPEGRYLNWGYCHILRSYSNLTNTMTNQAVDAGTLANVPGGWVSQEFRNNKSPMKFKPGSFQQVDVPASVLANGLRQNDFKGADQSLLAMIQLIRERAQSLSATVNLQDAIAPNAPAATTLGILQEKLIPTTTIIRRVVRAMSHEFRMMGALNFRYTDPETYKQVVNDAAADYKADFEHYSYDVELTASSAMTSQVQRMQAVSVISEQIPMIIQTGGDVRPIIQEVFAGMGKEDLYAKCYPDPNTMTPDQKAAMEEQRAMQERILQQQQIGNQLAEQTLSEKQLANQLKEREVSIKEMDQERRMMETMSQTQREAMELQIKVRDQQVDATIAEAEIEEILAQANLHYSKADSERLKSQADMLKSQIELTQRAIGDMRNA